MKVLIVMDDITPNTSGGIENFVYSIVRGISKYCPDTSVLLQVKPGTKSAINNIIGIDSIIYLEDHKYSFLGSFFKDSMFFRVGRKIIGKRLLNKLYQHRQNNWNRICEEKVDVVLYPWKRLPVSHRSKPVVMVHHDFRAFERQEGPGGIVQLLKQEPISAIIVAWPDPFRIFCELFPELIDIAFRVPFIFDTPPVEERLYNPINGNTLLYTSNNGKDKNHESLIHALGILKRRGVKPIRVFCTGPLQSDRSAILNELIMKEDVEEWIFFLGWVPRSYIHWLYWNTAGVITSSLYEAMSGTVLEGWQHGKPVACSDIPSIRAMTGLLDVEVSFFDPYKPEDIADSILTLFKEKKKYTEASLKAKEMLGKITLEKTASQYNEILMWACGKQDKPKWHPVRDMNEF